MRTINVKDDVKEKFDKLRFTYSASIGEALSESKFQEKILENWVLSHGTRK